MNEFFKEAREYGVVFLNEVIRVLGDDKFKVSVNFKIEYVIYIFNFFCSFLYFL